MVNHWPHGKLGVRHPQRFDRLLQAVSAEFNVPVEQIRQRGRHGNWARQAVIWLAHESLKLAHREIVELLGDLSESAVRDSLRLTHRQFGEPAGAALRDALAKVEAKSLRGP